MPQNRVNIKDDKTNCMNCIIDYCCSLLQIYTPINSLCNTIFSFQLIREEGYPELKKNSKVYDKTAPYWEFGQFGSV